MLNRYFFVLILLCALTGLSSVGHGQSRPSPYSAERAGQVFKVGQDAYLRGDLNTAIKNFKSALKNWPVHQEAWHWLTAAYQHLQQSEDYRYALFFRERTAWALDVDLRHARRIFDDVAQGRLKGRLKTATSKARYAQTAQELIIFYEFAICRAQVARETELAKKLSFNQKYGLEKLIDLTPDPNRRVCWPPK